MYSSRIHILSNFLLHYFGYLIGLVYLFVLQIYTHKANITEITLQRVRKHFQ